jgi:hypothetical protein
VDFLALVFFADVRFAEDFFAEDLRPDVFFAADFLPADFFFADFLRPGADGTLAPSWRASDNPMAMACFGFVTFLPLRPDLSLPRLNSCISRSTDFDAFGLYLRDDFFFAAILTSVCAGVRILPN